MSESDRICSADRFEAVPLKERSHLGFLEVVGAGAVLKGVSTDAMERSVQRLKGISADEIKRSVQRLKGISADEKERSVQRYSRGRLTAIWDWVVSGWLSPRRAIIKHASSSSMHHHQASTINTEHG